MWTLHWPHLNVTATEITVTLAVCSFDNFFEPKLRNTKGPYFSPVVKGIQRWSLQSPKKEAIPKVFPRQTSIN